MFKPRLFFMLSSKHLNYLKNALEIRDFVSLKFN